MWRFSLTKRVWHRHQPSIAEGAGVWPSARGSACATRDGIMFGGLASGASPKECWWNELADISGLEDGKFRSPGTQYGYGGALLSGMWRWEDDMGGGFH